MITQVILIFIALTIAVAILFFINLLKIKKHEAEEHEESVVLYLIAALFFVISILFYGAYTFLTTSYANTLALSTTIPLVGYGLIALPLSVMAFLVVLFPRE